MELLWLLGGDDPPTSALRCARLIGARLMDARIATDARCARSRHSYLGSLTPHGVRKVVCDAVYQLNFLGQKIPFVVQNVVGGVVLSRFL